MNNPTFVHLDLGFTPPACVHEGTSWGRVIGAVTGQTRVHPQSTPPIESYYQDSEHTGEVAAPWA
jgi:hypothetical protein